MQLTLSRKISYYRESTGRLSHRCNQYGRLRCIFRLCRFRTFHQQLKSHSQQQLLILFIFCVMLFQVSRFLLFMFSLLVIKF